MPWNTNETMNLKVQMISDWISERLNITDLSQKYSLSRPTVYKWIHRYDKYGIDGLKEQKKIPLHSPNQTPADVVELIVQEKLRNRHRGPKKVYVQLRKKYPELEFPSPSTIGEWLKKRGLVNERKKRKRVAPYAQPFQHCQEPNDVWSVDYKGQFYTLDKQVCFR